MTIGHATCSLTHISVIDPPETERNADPENPARNRLTMIVAIFCARAVGICHTILVKANKSSKSYPKRANMKQYTQVFVHKIPIMDRKRLNLDRRR